MLPPCFLTFDQEKYDSASVLLCGRYWFFGTTICSASSMLWACSTFHNGKTLKCVSTSRRGEQHAAFHDVAKEFLMIRIAFYLGLVVVLHCFL